MVCAFVVCGLCCIVLLCWFNCVGVFAFGVFDLVCVLLRAVVLLCLLLCLVWVGFVSVSDCLLLTCVVVFLLGCVCVVCCLWC